VDVEVSNTLFNLEESLDGIMRKKMLSDIMDLIKMEQLIRKRGNLSAPEKDGLTNPIIKLERNATARMFIEMFNVLILTGETHEDWKGARTILIYKCDDKDDPGNWRPITITSLIYRIIFCRIAQALHQVNEDCGKILCDPEQKGFVPKRAGCTEHTAVANMIINDAVTRKKELFILSTDLRDAFGSIPHDLMEMNLKKIGIQPELQKIIMSTYKNAYINIQSKDGETGNIHIGKGVKQGCPLVLRCLIWALIRC
jgi:hypothetical protein